MTEENPFDVDFSTIEKKRKKKKDEDISINESDDYTYLNLLRRIPTIPEDLDLDNNKLALSHPQMVKHNRRIVVLNFNNILAQLKRDANHVMHYIATETGLHCSLDNVTKRLLIKGRINQQNMETIIAKYVAKFIICKVCRSYDTAFIKRERLILIHCNNCKSEVSTSEERKVFI